MTSKPEKGWSGQRNIVINISRSVSLAVVFDFSSFLYDRQSNSSTLDSDLHATCFVAMHYDVFLLHNLITQWKTNFPGGGGVLPYKRLMECAAGWGHIWIDHYGAHFQNRVTRMGSHISDFWGKTALYIHG